MQHTVCSGMQMVNVTLHVKKYQVGFSGRFGIWNMVYPKALTDQICFKLPTCPCSRPVQVPPSQGFFHAEVLPLEGKNAIDMRAWCRGLLTLEQKVSEMEDEIGDGEVKSDLLADLKRGVRCVESLLQALEEQCPRQDEVPSQVSSVEEAACVAMSSVWNGLQRMQHLCICKSLLTLAEGKLHQEGYQDILPKKHHALAHALRANWEEEKAALQESPTVETLIKKISLCESACSTMENKLLEEKMFVDMRGKCGCFIDSFVQCLTSSVVDGAAAHVAPLKSFAKKYELLVPAVTTWTLKEVEWIFSADYEDSVKNDLNDLKQTRQEALAFAEKLKPVKLYKNPPRKLKEALAAAVKAHEEITADVKQISVLATMMGFADLVVNNFEQDPADVEKYTEKYYGESRECLAGTKLAELLREKKPTKKKEAKESKSTKEKKEKSGKEAKDKNKESKKKRESEMAEPKAKKKKTK